MIVRRTLLAVAMAAALVLALAGQALAQTPLHLHCQTTPNGKVHAVARGVTLHTQGPAFENFHANVHLGAFGGALAPDFSDPYTCPPS